MSGTTTALIKLLLAIAAGVMWVYLAGYHQQKQSAVEAAQQVDACVRLFEYTQAQCEWIMHNRVMIVSK